MRDPSYLLRAVLTFALLSMAASVGGQVQSYPNRPIRIIVPFGPGSTVDFVARIFSEQLGSRMGQPFVVDNRTGAGGTIGYGLVSKAPPDGYTLLMSDAGLAMTPSFIKSLPYNVASDFTPISQIVGTPMLLVVNPSVKANTLQELIALAHANPGKLNYASAGIDSPPHLASERFKIATHSDIVHIPYKGGSEMIAAAVSGQVQMLLTTMPTVLAQVKSGKLRALAVTTSGKRSPALPDVRSMSEAGVPDMAVYTWTGLLGPAGLSPDIVAQLHAEVLSVLAVPAVRDRFVAEGAELVGSSPQEFSSFMRGELQRWADVVKAAGITTD